MSKYRLCAICSHIWPDQETGVVRCPSCGDARTGQLDPSSFIHARAELRDALSALREACLDLWPFRHLQRWLGRRK